MNAVRTMLEAVSPNKALSFCGVSKKATISHTQTRRHSVRPRSAGEGSKDLPPKTRVRHAPYGRPSLRDLNLHVNRKTADAAVSERACAPQARDNQGRQETPASNGPHPVPGILYPIYGAVWTVGAT